VRCDSVSAVDDSEDSGDDDASSDSPMKPKRGRWNLISPEVVEALDAAKVSNFSATKIMSAIVSSAGVPVKETNINERSMRRLRNEERKASAESAIESFLADEVLTLHWDGKIVPSLGGRGLQDRQAVIVTGITTAQLLGAVPVPDGSAKEIVAAVVGRVRAWNVVSNIKAMSFDTTMVNTGTFK
jgi:hypothetical protein